MKKKKVKFGTRTVNWYSLNKNNPNGHSVYEVMIVKEFETEYKIAYSSPLNGPDMNDKQLIIDKSFVKNIHEEEISIFKYWWYKNFKYN